MIYQITYNENAIYSIDAIHSAIISMSGVSDWWHYLHNVYLVDTTKTQKELADNIHAQFPLLAFFVVKIDLENSNGVLNKEAWDWINNKTGIDAPLKKLLGTLSTLPEASKASSANADAIKDLLNLLKGTK